jgi:hydrogenase maturation protease
MRDGTGTVEPRILVAGIGNIFCQDDGFGPAVAGRLLGRPRHPAVRVVDYGIRGMHLAFDLLDGVDALVLVDALPGAGEPGELTVLQVGPDDIGDAPFDAHAMSPVAVLASLGSLGGQLPPTIVVGCRPLDVGPGIGLTPVVSRAVPGAVAEVEERVERLVADLPTPHVAGTTPRPEA